MRTTLIALLVVALAGAWICGTVYADKKSQAVVKVEDENGKKVPDAQIYLVPFDPPGPTIEGTTGKNGKKVFEGLEPNTLFHVFVFAPDGRWTQVWMYTDADGDARVTATVK